ncbi:non-ribosomal peptide synthetase [Planomonospora sp. ID67723]|uniref:non-ribosomal peptide synthetase n=1 Tax=Planomonospora sp. ID67723 TaxID=2738134 RepID=UPI0018C41D8D|nr:non-ribosomal peptide synthetase [Planomonospora sp. ID67723]MBG0829101.1 non-ribosomal peptide synthetase [Planomonospora sp. ID67723]
MRWWAQVQPDQHAVVSGGQALTYAELDERSSRLAGVLRERGVGKGALVVLALERSPELVVAALAVMMAGGAYVGVDVDEPDARLAAVIADSGARLVIAREAGATRFAGADVLPIERAWDGDALSLWEGPEITPGDLGYVVYTSGSTGVPKGVLVPHEGLANLAAWHQRTFEVMPGDRVSQLARPSFDAWALEVWPCLAAGATLCLMEGRLPGSSDALAQWISEQGITVCFLTTVLATELFDQRVGASLRVLLTGGEKLRRRPPADRPYKLFNLYGPTETSVVATYAEVGTYGGAPPIGYPLPGMRAYLLDEERRPVPPGSVGELHIGGTGVALGYLNRPELTAQRFTADPADLTSRMYATGDLARELPEGGLAFVGRADDQVKVRGFRIEPGEVESALRGLPEVREAVVVKSEQADQLVAAVVPADPANRPDPVLVRRDLARRLPDYMVPGTVTVLDALPMTPHGKVDRKALARPQEPAGPEPDGGDLRTDTERALAELWCEVLQISSVDRDDSFFERGGDSLLAIRLASRARQRGLRMVADDLFEYDVLHELAASVSAASPGT